MHTIRTAFSTPIFIRDIEDSEGVNDRLTRIILFRNVCLHDDGLCKSAAVA